MAQITNPTFQNLRDEAASMLWKTVDLSDDPTVGKFELQVHRDYPDAPLSPIYMAMRKKGVKTGTLEDADFDLIGQTLAAYANENGMFDQTRYVAGIPAAGEPFVTGMIDRLNSTFSNARRFYLRKETGEDGKTQIIPPENLGELPIEELMQDTLLVDDLVTKAGTKIQAVKATRYFGANVKDMLVMVNRSGGLARPALAEIGVELHSVWEFDHLLEYWASEHRFGNKDETDAWLQAIQAYPKQLAAYLEAQG